MQRIFGGPPDGDGAVTVTGQDAYHLARVLRMREGDEVILSDPAGRDHLCRIEAAAPDAVRLRAVGSRENPGEPPYRAVLYQGMPKGDKPETVVQKAVELGAAEIVFVVTERAISRPDEKTAEKKRERYARVAEAAAKQCGRGSVPGVRFLPSFAAALAEAAGTLSLFCYDGGGTEPLSALLPACPPEERVSLFIGPEGGFSDAEAGAAAAANCRFCGLGPRILRTETAGAHALSCLSFAWERGAEGPARPFSS